MINLNRAILTGHVDQKPKLMVNLDNGKEFCTFKISIVDICKNLTKTIKISVICYADLAKNCCNYLDSDLPVMVEGKIDSKNGKLVIVANNVVFMESKQKGEDENLC